MRRSLAVIFVVATTLVWALSSRATGAIQHDPKFELAALVTQKMAEYNLPGVAFGIVRNGQVIARGFGVTSVDDSQAITPDTLFPLASISKTVAATAIMRLVEQGKIDLSAPVHVRTAKGQDDSGRLDDNPLWSTALAKLAKRNSRRCRSTVGR